MSRLMKSAVAAVAALVAVQTASSALLIPDITQTREDGKIVVVFSTVDAGTWTVPSYVAGSMEVLVVGGGGGGGRKGGGGGGGGFYFTTSFTPSSGTVSLGIGAGGIGGTSVGTFTAGSQSSFDTLIAYGGGVGDPGNALPQTYGGHSGANNQGDPGYAGGATNGAGGYGAGAGGGAGAVGLGWVNLMGGNGKTSSIISASFAATNGIAYDGGYYGGGGGGWYDGGNNDGGLGGGGDGSVSGGAGVSGINGLGGGGGDARDSGSGGNGGSGIVIIAYQAIPEPATFGMIGAAAIAMLLRRRFVK